MTESDLDRPISGLPAIPTAETSGDRLRLPLFTCGDMLPEELVARMVERAVSCRGASLRGFRVVDTTAVAWAPLSPSSGDTVRGEVYLDLGEEDLHRLDAYVGVNEDLFHRIAAPVEVEGDDEFITAWVYLPTTRLLSRIR